MSNKALLCYRISLFSYFGLFALLMVWNTLWFPSSKYPVALLLLLGVFPLLLPLRGFLAANPRSCTWMAYLSIGYVMHGSVESYVNAVERWPALLEVALSGLLFCAALLFIRYQKRL